MKLVKGFLQLLVGAVVVIEVCFGYHNLRRIAFRIGNGFR